MPEERRLVTVLFADVAGSTALGEALDPEDLRALMSRYFTIANEAVTAHGGTVEKFIGDAVMAVFGLPVAHGDDPARALLAALQLRDRARADPTLGDALPIRLGVNTGDVIASSDAGAGGDFLITGDAVNTAARLQQAAEPWAVLVGERTIRAVGSAFDFGPPIGAQAKGKALPIAAAELRGPASNRRASRTRLVGREDDLAQLELVARRAFRERRPYLVSIIAPPGVGKSRLLEEFLDRLPALTQDPVVALAQCLPYGQRWTYWPMRGLLLGLLGEPDDIEPDDLRRATRTWLEGLGDPDPARDAEMLVATIGAGETETADRSVLFAAWRTALELAAAQRPVVLAIEDLHWSSDSLLDLVETLLVPNRDVGLLMISLARPELLDRRPEWGGGRRDYVSLELAALDDESVTELVQDLLEVPAPELVEAVVARSDGNPFYAGEIVRSVLERVGPQRDPAAIGSALASLPDTVQGTVLARLDLLGPTARRVLQLGAVLGRTFRIGGLVALEPALADDVRPAVEALIERDLVRSSGPETLTFRHILIREVAYGTLPRAERARLHEAAGRWLEATAGERADEFAELIAYHYREAISLGSLGGAEPSPELRRSGVRWLRRAGEVANAAAAQVEAPRHMQAAIELAEPDELPELYETLGTYLISGPGAADALLEGLRLARERGRAPDVELRMIARIVISLTRWHGAIGEGYHATTSTLIADGRRLLPLVADPHTRSMFLIGEAFEIWTLHGAVTPERAESARVAGEQGLELAREVDDVILQSAALDALSSLDLADDDYRTSHASVLTRLSFGDRLDFVERLDARVMDAWHRATLGDIVGANTAATEAVARLRPGEAPLFAMSLTAWIIATYHVLGRWDDALAAGRRFHAWWVELGRPPAGFAAHGFLAAIDVGRARGDRAAVDQATGAFLEIAAAMGEAERIPALRAFVRLDLDGLERDAIGRWRGFYGRIDHLDRAIAACTDRGHDLDPAVLREIVDHCDPRGIRLVAAQARRAIAAADGDPEPLREAVVEFESMAAAPYVARARIELGRMTGDDTLVATGIAGLEALGDLDQLARVSRTRPSS
jgi:class 3 adenylate cyclase